MSEAMPAVEVGARKVARRHRPRPEGVRSTGCTCPVCGDAISLYVGTARETGPKKNESAIFEIYGHC